MPPKDTTQNFVDKLVQLATQPRTSQKFSPSKVSRYMVPQNDTTFISYANVETSRPHKQGLPKIYQCFEEVEHKSS